MKRIQLRTEKKPYTDLHSAPAVEAIMTAGAGAAVIDFWAPWCAPCKALAPHYERVAEAYAEQPVKFYKINTEAQPALAQAFHVASIPTMLFIHDGEILDVNVGALDATRLSAKVEWLLSKARGEGLLTRVFGWGHKKA